MNPSANANRPSLLGLTNELLNGTNHLLQLLDQADSRLFGNGASPAANAPEPHTMEQCLTEANRRLNAALAQLTRMHQDLGILSEPDAPTQNGAMLGGLANVGTFGRGY